MDIKHSFLYKKTFKMVETDDLNDVVNKDYKIIIDRETFDKITFKFESYDVIIEEFNMLVEKQKKYEDELELFKKENDDLLNTVTTLKEKVTATMEIANKKEEKTVSKDNTLSYQELKEKYDKFYSYSVKAKEKINELNKDLKEKENKIKSLEHKDYTHSIEVSDLQVEIHFLNKTVNNFKEAVGRNQRKVKIWQDKYETLRSKKGKKLSAINNSDDILYKEGESYICDKAIKISNYRQHVRYQLPIPIEVDIETVKKYIENSEENNLPLHEVMNEDGKKLWKIETDTNTGYWRLIFVKR